MKNLFFIILILGCKPDINQKVIIPNNEFDSEINFLYGDEVANRNLNDSVGIWKPVVDSNENRLCIFSHPSIYAGEEKGLYLKICSKFLNNFYDIFQNALEFETEIPVVNIDDKFELRIITLSDIISEWKSNAQEFLIVGDRILAETVQSEEIDSRIFYTLYGKNKNLHSSFSLSYFSVGFDGEYWSFLYPQIFKEGRKTSIKYILLKFNKNYISFFSADELDRYLKSKIDNHKSTCVPNKIIITEISPLSSSKFGKYIELQNKNSTITCFSSVELSINDKKFIYENSGGYLLPGEVYLWGEESSKLNIHSFTGLDWKELKSSSKLSIKNSNIEYNYTNTNINTFIFEDGERSIQTNDSQCSELLDVYSDRKLCIDPGVALTKGSDTCKLKDFILSEINPVGLNNKLNGKYLELIYKGERDCNLGNFSLLIDDNDIPLSLSNKVAKYNDIYVIGRPEYFQNVNLIPRNLDFLNLKSSISIKRNSNLVNLFKTEDEQFILKSSSDKSFSLSSSNIGWRIHSIYKSPKILPEYSLKHNGSPGEEIPFSVGNGSAKITEVSVYGSYSAMDSYPEDKFIEINSDFQDELKLKLTFSNDTKLNYRIPPIIQNGYIVISENVLKCFPGVEIYSTEKLPLGTDPMLIELSYNNKVLDKIDLSEIGYGEENRSKKIRRSSTLTNGNKTWKTTFLDTISDGMNSACYPFTHATPGRNNSYVPFIEPGKTLMDDPGIRINFPDSLQSYEYGVYGATSQNEKIYSINKQFPFLNIQIGTVLQEELLYINWKNSGEINILNNSGLRIEGLQPHPVNSQNEWVLLCNRGVIFEKINQFEIQDSSFFDRIVPYSTRFGEKTLFNTPKEIFVYNSDELAPNECGFLIDPDAFEPDLLQLNQNKVPIFTVRDDSSIGNGIGIDEGLNLFKLMNGRRILISSYGLSGSNQPFKIRATENDKILLKEGRRGESAIDYRIIK